MSVYMQYLWSIFEIKKRREQLCTIGLYLIATQSSLSSTLFVVSRSVPKNLKVVFVWHGFPCGSFGLGLTFRTRESKLIFVGQEFKYRQNNKAQSVGDFDYPSLHPTAKNTAICESWESLQELCKLHDIRATPISFCNLAWYVSRRRSVQLIKPCDPRFHLLFSAEFKPRGYFLEHFWQADLGHIGQAIVGVKVPNSSHMASIQQ